MGSGLSVATTRHRRLTGFAALGALLAIALASISAHASSFSSLTLGHFVPVPTAMLPHGGATYQDATCPSDQRCYVVGAGSPGGILTMTADGGRTWATTALPSTAGLVDYSISCPSASVCYVGGTDLVGDTVLLATHDAGSKWTLGHIPSGVIITSIGCGAINACVAVGSHLPSRPESSVVTTEDGGITWVPHTAPTNDMLAVRCIDEQHCWAAGPGAWFTPDLGATWRDVSPPSGPPCATVICNVYYSETVDIEFQSREDGWVVGGDQCGGQTATQCQGVAMRTSDGGLTWTVSDASLRYPFGWQIACEGTTCLLDTQGFSFSIIAATTNNGATFTEMQRVGTLINALACTPAHHLCVAAGGYRNVPAILTLGTIAARSRPASASVLSTVGSSLASPSELLDAPEIALVNALITVGVIILITFPSQLFNRTYEQNHERIRAWWEHRWPWIARLRSRETRGTATRRGVLSFAIVLVAGGILASLLDPAFGANIRSLALFIGAVLALVTGVAVSGVASGAYRHARHRAGHWRLRALPSALLIAIVCVVISRITNFQPGYLYGLIGGVAFTSRLSRRDEGLEVAITSLCSLVVSIAAWLAWVPVSSAATADAGSFALALAENFLAAVFLSGIVGLVISLVPLRFLPGERVARWHRGAWAALFGVACFAVVEVMLRPQSSAARGHNDPVWTTLGLFLSFGAASVLFWAYCKVQSDRKRAETGG